MKTQTTNSPVTLGFDAELDHWYCARCFPNADFAFCGTDIRDAVERGPEMETATCVVCLDLDYCPICDPA